MIPAYNEEGRIAECLDSVLAGGYSNMEVIVVDDCSTDKTVQVASKYPVRIIERKSRGGAANARNDGLKEAKGEIVAFVDADCTVDKGWLNFLVSHYTDDNVAGVGGVIFTKQTTLFAKYRNCLAREDYLGPENSLVDDIPGGNSSYRTEILRSVGGFDPAFAQPAAHETFELAHRLIKNGYKLIGDPRSIVWHSREGSLRSWISEAYAEGYCSLSFLQRYRLGEFLMSQLRQIAFLAFLGMWIVSLAGFIPLVFVLGITAIGLLFELARAVQDSSVAVLHYRSVRYFVFIPVDFTLRIILYVGYIMALVTAAYHGASKLFRGSGQNRGGLIQ